MRSSTRTVAVLAALTVACADRGFAPFFDVDGPTVRRQLQRKAASVPARELASAGETGERSALVGDALRLPLTSPDKAELGRTRWAEESFAIELTGNQLLLLRRLLAGDAGAGVLERVFAPGARIAPLELSLADATVLGPGVARRAWTAPDARRLDREEWSREAERWRGSFARLRWATFIPTDVDFEGGRALVDVEWQVNVELEDGGIRHDRGTWSSEWIPPGGAAPSPRPSSSEGWLCVALEPRTGETLVADAPAFVDVTGDSLGGTPWSPLLPRPEEWKEHYRGIALVDVDGDQDLDIVTAVPNSLLLGDGEGRFEDVTERAGIARERGYTGVQAADFDRDGDIDLVFSGKRTHLLLYSQVEPGRFEAVPVTVSRNDNFPTSLTSHDVDGDGWLDLLICGYGPLVNPGPNDPENSTNARHNQVLRGGPSGFTDVTEAWGLWREASRWSFIGTFGDADEDGDADLYLANDFGPNVLYRRVRGSPPLFEPEVESSERIATGFSMSATWADLDGDLDLDMYVSNMESVEARRLERLPGNAETEPWERELREMMSSGNTVLLQEQVGDERVLVEAPDAAGGRDAKWAWGAVVFDWDEDGDLDIQCVNGFFSVGIDDGRDWDTMWWRYSVGDMKRDAVSSAESFSRHYPESAAYGWSWDGHQRSVFYQNDGSAAFQQIAPVLGLDQVADGRAIAMGDIDQDGDYDLVGGNVNAPHLYVLRNDTPGRRFAWVELVPADRRSAAGARILLTAGGRTQRRDVVLGEGFLCQNELARHFGLGDARRIERIEITWPDGQRTLLADLPVDRRFRVTQGVDGWEELPLRQRNWNATRRLGPVEWTNDPHQIALVDDSLDLALNAAVAPPPLAAERGTATTRAVVLWDPDRPGARAKLEVLAELAGIEALEVVIVSPAGVAPPELPLELSVTHAVWSGEEGRTGLLRALDRWCGPREQPWPVVLYCAGERVEGLSRGAIVADRVRAYCASR